MKNYNVKELAEAIDLPDDQYHPSYDGMVVRRQAAQILRNLEWRPIEEAPKDISVWAVKTGDECMMLMQHIGESWYTRTGEYPVDKKQEPTHFLPLNAIPMP